MALVSCPGCGRQISSFAVRCPHCGCDPLRPVPVSPLLSVELGNTGPLPYVSAGLGTLCFALSLFCATVSASYDTILAPPFALFLAIVSVAVDWSACFTRPRPLSLVAAALYLVAAVAAFPHSVLWALAFLLPIAASILAFFFTPWEEV